MDEADFESPNNIRYQDLEVFCDKHFYFARMKGSHRMYRTGHREDPLINIQPDHDGGAKPFQVDQVRRAYFKGKKLKTLRSAQKERE